MKTKILIIGVAAVSAASLFFTACAGPDGHRTDHFTGKVSAEGQQEVKDAGAFLLTAGQIYSQIGYPGLPPQDRATYVAALQSGQALYQAYAYAKAPIPPEVINTGNDTVNHALLVSTDPSHPVTPADIATLQSATNLMAHPPGIPMQKTNP